MTLQSIPNKIHFVGVGGIGMSALAQFFLQRGHTVTGSDRTSNAQTRALAKAGVRVYVGHNKYNVHGAQLVVRTSAVSEDNVEIAEAKKMGVEVLLREELLGIVFNGFATRIAVCGTHGKTTVTAMIHCILDNASVSHTAFIGGLYHGSNFYFGRDVAVAEACEYNRSFFNLRPSITVCTNAEYDHPDCYTSARAVRRAFKKFLSNTDKNGTVILPKSLSNLAPANVRTVFFDEVLVGDVVQTDGKPCFYAMQKNRRIKVKLNVVGKHNVNNALAAMAAANALNLSVLETVKALERFDGVDRRWTEYEKKCKCVVDYAHHPTEIACSVAAAKSVCKGKVICVFQPHTYTRTKAFFKRFATCFAQADEVAYLPVYSAREQPLRFVNSQALAKLAKRLGLNARYFADFKGAAKWIEQTAEKDDLVLILGAGDVVDLIKWIN